MSGADVLVAARAQFDRSGVVIGDAVRQPILRSWARCAALGLDMGAEPRFGSMTSSELRDACARNETLRGICRPEIEALHVEGKETASIVILTDAAGLILEALGNVEFGTRASRVALRPGVQWSESSTGTNAIGAAIAERRPVEVRGAEHYFELHRILSCSAVPILNPCGEAVGVLDLSGHAAVHHLHALGLVQLAVDQIEHRFFNQQFEHHIVLRFHSNEALLGTPREGILVFDDHRLVAANRHGLALLGLERSAVNERNFRSIFANSLASLEDKCTLWIHGGGVFHGRLVRPSERLVPRAPRSRPGTGAPFEPWFDATVQGARDRATRLVNADVPILLQGETGVGKEVFARQVHLNSVRRAKPFVAVNCAALPEGLVESELFGYEEGAFTGARRHGSIGLFRAADGGVLFLDEIGDMPIGLQIRLLRVLQDREVTPLGGTRPIAVDFAIICATHCDLRDLVEAGSFRSDLYFRIAQCTIELPPVRALSDRADMVRSLWERLGGPSSGVVLLPETVDLLATYEWPGNFRQLVGTLRALQVLVDPEEPLRPEGLPPEIRDGCRWPVEGIKPSRIQPGLASRLEEATKETMRQALLACDGNVSEAARRLGVSRSTIYRRLIGGRMRS
jgi:sigma-54 dependent transcriptional regulator, acetoin dehydrogenase operon transcriptional activator AcoR